MEIFSECVIMMEVYCFMMFTDYVKNIDRKYEIGYIAIALVFFHFFVCCEESCIVLIKGQSDSKRNDYAFGRKQEKKK